MEQKTLPLINKQQGAFLWSPRNLSLAVTHCTTYSTSLGNKWHLCYSDINGDNRASFCWEILDFSWKRRIFLELELRTFQLQMSSYHTGRGHESLQAWLAQSVSDSREFSTNSRALFSRQTPNGPYLGPACTEDSIAWDGKISIILICAWHILILFHSNCNALSTWWGRIAVAQWFGLCYATDW